MYWSTRVQLRRVRRVLRYCTAVVWSGGVFPSPSPQLRFGDSIHCTAVRARSREDWTAVNQSANSTALLLLLSARVCSLPSPEVMFSSITSYTVYEFVQVQQYSSQQFFIFSRFSSSAPWLHGSCSPRSINVCTSISCPFYRRNFRV